MYAFVRRPRWVLIHIVLLVVVALFGVAGFWQLDRLAERREHNAFVRERRSQPVTPIGRLVSRPDDAEQRRVRAIGRYDPGREVILIGRSGRGRPGNHVLTPLVINEGRAIVVDRGWVPVEIDSPRDAHALPPDGVVDVTGILLPSEGSGPLAGSGGDDLSDAVARIDVARIARSLPYRTFPHYLVLQKQAPSQDEDLPGPVTLQAIGEGSHLIYAVQWFCFIPIALVGYGAILRREARRRSSTAPVKT